MDSAVEAPQLREVIAHAWFTMGFPPVRSLVLVGVESSGSSPGFVARVDLPPPRYRRHVAEVMAGAAQRTGLRSVVLLVVLDPSSHAPPTLERPGAALVTAIRARLRAARVAVLDAVVVAGGRYRSLMCVDPACCPPQGHPLGDLRTTAAAAGMIMRGRSLAEDEAGLVADVAPAPWPASVVIPAQTRSPVADLERWRGMVAALAGAPDGPREPDPADVAWLVPALEDTRLRDAALVSLLPRGARMADAIARGTVTGVPDLHESEEHPPAAEVFEAARVLLATVARGAPAGRRAEALALLAWMSWWQGVGARSRLLAALALHDRPGHRLAGLVDTLLLRGVPPSWVRPGPDPRGCGRPNQ
ncbi:MAG TPA: DUF4192 domain-containing protein [Kineosporiaceae bacterium]|nr:DUF4192 domain-containing protein [Kineosporiaceae bacterium]